MHGALDVPDKCVHLAFWNSVFSSNAVVLVGRFKGSSPVCHVFSCSSPRGEIFRAQSIKEGKYAYRSAWF